MVSRTLKCSNFPSLPFALIQHYMTDLEILSHWYNQVVFLVIAGKDGRDGVNGDIHDFINIIILLYKYRL